MSDAPPSRSLLRSLHRPYKHLAMLSPVSLSILAAHVFVLGVSAHLDLLDGLPSCWLDCLSNTDDGCDSAKCK